MIFGVDGPKGPSAAERAKAKAKTTGTSGGASFAQMLDAASSVAETDAAGMALGVGVAGAFLPIEDELPQDAKGQARELLKTLKELAEDSLSGSPTAAVGKLESLANEMDERNLSAQQKAVVDEVRTRAAVEVAKIKG